MELRAPRPGPRHCGAAGQPSKAGYTGPPQRGIAILGVCGLTPVGLELARPPAAAARRPQPTVCVFPRETVCLFDKEIISYSMTKSLFLVEKKLFYAPEQATGLGSLDGSPGA